MPLLGSSHPDYYSRNNQNHHLVLEVESSSKATKQKQRKIYKIFELFIFSKENIEGFSTWPSRKTKGKTVKGKKSQDTIRS